MTRKPKMTPDEARSFDRGVSLQNAVTVKQMLAARPNPCSCEPYEGVFTYRRWKAQGFQVQKGQKSMRVPVFKTKTSEVKNKQTGQKEEKRISIPSMSFLFCQCQVKPVNQPAKQAA